MRKHDVLFRDQSDGDAVTDGDVEEITDLFRGHVLYAFLKPANQRGEVNYLSLVTVTVFARCVDKRRTDN